MRWRQFSIRRDEQFNGFLHRRSRCRLTGISAGNWYTTSLPVIEMRCSTTLPTPSPAPPGLERPQGIPDPAGRKNHP
jgi:hypothetical protein